MKNVLYAFFDRFDPKKQVFIPYEDVEGEAFVTYLGNRYARSSRAELSFVPCAP